MRQMMLSISLLILMIPKSWAVVYVDKDSTGTPNGNSWVTAWRTIQQGVDQCSTSGGGEVWVAEGIYTASTVPVITMKEKVHIYGGFTGNETMRSQRSWATNVTIIDGEDAHRCVLGANNATLDGFTVTRGNGTIGLNAGAGMYNNSASPTVTNCIFKENNAGGTSGGGICNYKSSPVINYCTFSSNSAGSGGGIDVMIDSFPKITSCIFLRNSAVNYGGGIRCTFPMTVKNCLFIANSANYGGGIFNKALSTVVNCTFVSNNAVFAGGGIYSGETAYSPVVNNCILWGNTSSLNPQIVISVAVEPTPPVRNCCIQGGYTGAGVNIITGSPLFIDGTDGGNGWNLRLQSSSPCINSGTSSDAPSTDIDGISRPQGSGYDIGAYEYYSISVPNVVGMSLSAAQSAITNAILIVGTLTQQSSPTVPSGVIMSQSPTSGTSVQPGSAVNLTVSIGSLAEGEGEIPVEGEGEILPEGEGEVYNEGEGEQAEGECEEITLLLPGNVQLNFVWIPSGEFQMGRYPGEVGSSADEDPQHGVTLAQGFWMGKYEITQQQWLAVMGSWPGTAPEVIFGLGDDYPAYNISWEDTKQFIMFLNIHVANSGQGPLTVRLPSEAEWEYACRAGTQTRFYFGDSLDCGYICEDCAAGVLPGNRTDYMWYCGNNTPEGTKIVGTKIPNAFCLYDMSGNVYEWCEDDYHSNYTDAPLDGSAWIDSPRAGYRVLRGGRWNYRAQFCRSSRRNGGGTPTTVSNTIGFRLAADQIEPAEGEGETPIEGEGEVPVEGEGEILPEGEGEVSAEGEVLPEGEGEVVIEGEGEIQIEGEPIEGELLGEGEILPEGEGEMPLEGEGETTEEGEGEVSAEGEGLLDCELMTVQFEEEWPLMAADLGLNDNVPATGSGKIPERWGLQSVLAVACKPEHPHHDWMMAAYFENLASLEAESPSVVARVEPYKHVLAGILLINRNRCDHFIALLGLQNDYEVAHGVAKDLSEPFSEEGDLDYDGLTNLQEYQIVLLHGGSWIDYAKWVLDPNPYPENETPLAVWPIVVMLLFMGTISVHRIQREIRGRIK